MAIPRLTELAYARYRTLTRAEHALLAAAQGAHYELGWHPQERIEDLPVADWKTWPAASVVRAPLVRWLCAAPEARAHVAVTTLAIAGSRVEGELDLAGLDLPFALFILRSAVPEGVDLSHARGKQLTVADAWVGAIVADGCRLEGDLALRCRCPGPVSFYGASIEGSVGLDGHYGGERAPAVERGGAAADALAPATVSFAGASLRTAVVAESCVVEGRLSFNDAQVAGDLIVEGLL
ncbi:MAG TPA: hypothetical protein VFX28_20195, partial [Methylomirabilota bacterium]|nr:hypothetical protein [Methylomirabilota bacterium]